MKDLSYLEGRRNAGYLQQAIPNQRDTEIDLLVSSFVDMKTLERADLLSAVLSDYTSVLRCYAERMASLAVRSSNSAYALRGLVALGIARPAERDLREILLVMGVVCDALIRCHRDVEEASLEVAGLFPAEIAQAIIVFSKRRDLGRILSKMGYIEGSDAEGFRYLRTW